MLGSDFDLDDKFTAGAILGHTRHKGKPYFFSSFAKPHKCTNYLYKIDLSFDSNVKQHMYVVMQVTNFINGSNDCPFTQRETKHHTASCWQH